MNAKLSPEILQKFSEKLLRASKPLVDYKIDPDVNKILRSKGEVVWCRHDPYCNSKEQHEKRL